MSKLKRKFLSALLTFAVLASLVPIGAVPALADPGTESENRLTVTGDSGNYSYENNVLTITGSEALTISGMTTQDHIVIADGVNANLTLNGVNIIFTDGFENEGYNHENDDEAGTCALAISEGSTLNLTIKGENTLQSGAGRAGIFVAEDADLTINGDGNLSATGGHSAAGIGGDAWNNAGDIKIESGTITATGGVDGAGIGGGHANDAAKDENNTNHLYGGYESITISGGDVTAIGTRNAAGIGTGCWAKTGGPITIKNATVNAKSTGDNGSRLAVAAIGAGYYGEQDFNGCAITITDSIVTVSNLSGETIVSGSDAATTLNCIAITGDEWNVHGTYTLKENLEIASGQDLIISENAQLIVDENVVVTNNGYIGNNGSVSGKGSIVNNGMMSGDFSQITVKNETALQGAVSYLDAQGNRQKCETYQSINMAGNYWRGDGWYVVAGNLSVNERITVKGDVHLILMDGSSLTANDGIRLDGEDSNLTIYAQSTGESMGCLTAYSYANDWWDSYDAAIGSDEDGSCGDITINGGRVITNDGNNNCSVGIGSGEGGSCGDITINGGVVNAFGGGYSTGIGSDWDGSCGVITINGGEISAIGGEDGAGIGSGYEGTCGDIIINGGTVRASSEYDGAGIGTGDYGSCEDISITGGMVAATSKEDGAGIGAGCDGECGVISISGGHVRATSEKDASGIGCGDDGTCEAITITGGSVTAIALEDAAGIGSGNDDSICGPITITGGHITAIGGSRGAGIGSGYGYSWDEKEQTSYCTSVRISGGSVFAFAGEGSEPVAAQESKISSPNVALIDKDGNTTFSSDTVTLQSDAVIPTNVTLTVPQEKKLVVPDEMTLTVEGNLTVNGVLVLAGSLERTGEVTINGELHQAADAWEYDSSAHWHLCDQAGCTEHIFDRAAHTMVGNTCSVCGYGESYTGKYSYEVTTNVGAGGAISVDRYATEGDKVTIEVTPDEAYLLEDLTIISGGRDVEVTDNGDGTFSFTMPSGDVKISATFAEDPDWTEPEEPATDVSEIFLDIAPDAWYKDAVQYAYDNGLMTGVSANEFAPEQTTTRAMIVSILARLEGVTSAESAGFADVDDEWYATAVNWAASVGVVSGTGEGNFSPNAAITREQLAAMLMNYSAWKGKDVSARADLSNYTDQPSAWAEEAISWSVAENLISGVTADELQPQGNATRAQVAAILQRYLGA